MHEKKRHEDRWNANRHEPFIADVAWRVKHQPMRRQLGVKFLDQRLERCSLKAQAKHGDPALEKILVAERRPIGFHFVHSISLCATVSRLRRKRLELQWRSARNRF